MQKAIETIRKGKKRKKGETGIRANPDRKWRSTNHIENARGGGGDGGFSSVPGWPPCDARRMIDVVLGDPEMLLQRDADDEEEGGDAT